MQGGNHGYTEEFKKTAVAKLHMRTLASVAQEMGCHERSLSNWRKKYIVN